MNKIKQNKITFFLILISITVIFSSLTVLSLPVLFNYKSKVIKIEKNFYKNFKIYLNSSNKISYKPFPKPHLLVENASLRLNKLEENENFIEVKNLKIFVSLKDIYLRPLKNFASMEITDTNLEFGFSDLKQIRKHLYQNINKPIILNNCKLFVKNKENDVILISPIKKASNKIDKKKKLKYFNIEGKIFGINYKSQWKRNYILPKASLHEIKLFNPNLEIKNKFFFKNKDTFGGENLIKYSKDKLNFKYFFNDNKIEINSLDNNSNYKIDGDIQISPFYFDGSISINDKKIETIIDNFLVPLYLYDQNFIGNFNGKIKLKFNNLKNKLLKSGEMTFDIKEKKILTQKAFFELDKIGYLKTKIKFLENNGEYIFKSKNTLSIENPIEFAKVFQISSKDVKKIKKIYFDIQKGIDETDFIISNIKIDNEDNLKKSEDTFIIKNIQNLRASFRKVLY